TAGTCGGSGVSSRSCVTATSHRGANVLADETDDVLGRCAGGEELLDAHRLQPGDVLGGNDPAPEDGDIVRALLGEELEDTLEEVVVGAGQHGQPDRVRVFLDPGRPRRASNRIPCRRWSSAG